MGGVDFVARPGAGTLWQLVTHPLLRSLGLGGRLIGEAEARIRRRGVLYAALGVEGGNRRARALYERLGYRPTGRERASWMQGRPDGGTELYETEVTILRKPLATPSRGG